MYPYYDESTAGTGRTTHPHGLPSAAGINSITVMLIGCSDWIASPEEDLQAASAFARKGDCLMTQAVRKGSARSSAAFSWYPRFTAATNCPKSQVHVVPVEQSTQQLSAYSQYMRHSSQA